MYRAEAGIGAEIVAVYGAGQEINYDGWIDNDGYIWISYIGGSEIVDMWLWKIRKWTTHPD